MQNLAGRTEATTIGFPAFTKKTTFHSQLLLLFADSGKNLFQKKSDSTAGFTAVTLAAHCSCCPCYFPILPLLGKKAHRNSSLDKLFATPSNLSSESHEIHK